MSAEPPSPPARRELRARLRAERAAFLAGPGAGDAAEAIGREVRRVLRELEPTVLGLYWPVRGEFNARDALRADERLAESVIALPFARREPREMQYRLWDGTPPTSVDDCGIPAPDGAPVVPDVVLAPCVGYTDGGYRLGYGGGYFDRWLAAHPHACAVGIALSVCRIDTAAFAPQPYDVAMAVVVTERGVV